MTNENEIGKRSSKLTLTLKNGVTTPVNIPLNQEVENKEREKRRKGIEEEMNNYLFRKTLFKDTARSNFL